MKSFISSISQLAKRPKLAGKRRHADADAEEYEGEPEPSESDGVDVEAKIKASGLRCTTGRGQRIRTGGNESQIRKDHASSKIAGRVQAPPPEDAGSSSESPQQTKTSPILGPDAGNAVGALRESRRALRSAVIDPLDDVRRVASTAVPVADAIQSNGVGKKPKLVEKDVQHGGRVCVVCLFKPHRTVIMTCSA